MKQKQDKKRVVVDYKNITQDLLQLLSDEYPYGFEDETIHYTNAKGERVEAVQLETEDTKYLVKISSQLVTKFEAFQDDEDEDEDEIGESEDIDETFEED